MLSQTAVVRPSTDTGHDHDNGHPDDADGHSDDTGGPDDDYVGDCTRRIAAHVILTADSSFNQARGVPHSGHVRCACASLL
jgi:hypothetical protein